MQFSVELLLEQNIRSIERIDSLEKSFNTALDEIKTLKLANNLLTTENVKLKDQLGLNSTNSSQPPSKDLYKSKTIPLSKSDKKPGAQLGHIGVSRKPLPPDHIVECELENKCECGGEIIDTNSLYTHQKIELPVIKPIVTNFLCKKGICNKCSKKHTAALPQSITPDLLGSNAKVTIATLTGMFGNSKRDVQDMLKNIFNLKIGLGLVSKTEERVSEKCESIYNQYLEEVKDDNAPMHIDETGAKNKGEKKWAWMFTNHTTSVLKIAESRGMKVLQSILPDYKGIVVSDRYAAYNFFNEQNRQICWAHLLRDFERLANSANTEVQKNGIELRSYCKEVFRVVKSFDNRIIEHKFYMRRMRKIRKKISFYLKRCRNIPNAPGIAGKIKNILKHENMMWRFLEFPGKIEITNNLAERQIRPFVIYRKNSFFTWSDRGMRFIERILSIKLTGRLRLENPYSKLLQLISA